MVSWLLLSLVLIGSSQADYIGHVTMSLYAQSFSVLLAVRDIPDEVRLTNTTSGRHGSRQMEGLWRWHRYNPRRDLHRLITHNGRTSIRFPNPSAENAPDDVDWFASEQL